MSIHVSCPISLETQGGCSPGRRVTDGRALKAVLPLEAVPQGAGTVPVRLLLSSVMLVMAGKDPPLPHESGRVPPQQISLQVQLPQARPCSRTPRRPPALASPVTV